MISFITGLPGAGKGVYAVLRIIDVLRTTEKPILTNFAIELYPWVRKLGRRRSRGEKGLLAHLHDTYGETFGAEKRIFTLTDEQMQYFYCWRVNHDGKLVEIQANRDARTGNIVSIDEAAFTETQPCYYLGDEGWKFWNARDFQKIDRGLQFYNAQHRKAGDDFDITAQAASQIDKQMRVLVQEYHTLVNHGYRKMGVFRQPNVISVVISNEPPELRSKTLTALPKVIKFDAQGIGGSFDTAKGAGVQGAGADIERKRKGLPWWGLPVLIAVMGAGIIFVAKGGGYMTGKMLYHAPESGKQTFVEKLDKIGVKTGTATNVTPPVTKVIQTNAVVEPHWTDGLAIVGWVRVPGYGERILLNNGMVLVPGDGVLENWDEGRRCVLVAGKVIGWERKKAYETRQDGYNYNRRGGAPYSVGGSSGRY